MDARPPVVQSSQVHVRDVDAARQLAVNLYGNVVIDYPHRPRQLSWWLKSYSVGAVTVVAARQSQDGEMSSDSMGPYYVIGSVRGGAMEIETNGHSVPLVRGESAVMLNPNSHGKAVWRAGMQSRNVLISPPALSAHLSAMLGTEITTAPYLKPPLDLRRGPMADLEKIIRLLHALCARKEGPPPSPHVLAHLREALFGGILFAIENPLSHILHKNAPTVGQRTARIAAEYLTAHAAEPISLADLAVSMGVGLRSLQRAFQSTYQMSLRAFLTTARLDLARRQIQAAQPGMTIAQILYASGFAHPGEFSAAYRKRFGENPSETMRRSLGAYQTALVLASNA